MFRHVPLLRSALERQSIKEFVTHETIKEMCIFMKRFIVLIAVTVICLYTSNEINSAQHKDHETKSTSRDHKTKADSVSISRTTDAKAAAAIREIVGRYLDLKNALANDKTKEAAAAGTALESAFKKFDKKALTASDRKVFEDVEDDAREHGEHIGANAGNIAHQREHFDMLSKDMYDLVAAFGSSQVLYKDFCPMYNNKKGAIWLSELKEIKNPYYGKKMLTCGSVKEEIK